MNGRTLRSKGARNALYIKANGRCAICDAPLSGGFHADHVIPWSVSQRTNVHEMQALCASCNLRKGVRHAPA